jgi:hypothetical protein
MWLRLGAALLVTLAALGFLEYFGARNVMGGRAPDDVRNVTQGPTRELFWFAIFAIVMVTSLLAAIRRWTGQLKRAAAPSRRR